MREDFLARSRDITAVIPEPDYSDSEEDCRQEPRPRAVPCPRTMTSEVTPLASRGLGGLPLAGDRQQLHRELAFNQKIGKNMLGKKTELQRAMERHREQQERRQQQDQQRSNRSSFELALEERLSRAEPKTPEEQPASADVTPEFLRVHARMRSKVNASS